MAVSKTRAKLVDVARQLFAKNGVDDTTMNEERKTHALYVFQEQRRHLYGSGGVGVRDAVGRYGESG